MPEEVRIWEILEGDKLRELERVKLDLEERIERWLEQDISVLSDDLLVIGRQVGTDFGGVIDLLCLDSKGDVVIVELKRDRTPREVTAQALDYASWVKDLSNEKISAMANAYLGEQDSLEQAFENKFGDDLPETLNEQHMMLIVASEVDDSTERIINYLSDTHGVGINYATFQHFHDQNDGEYLARLFLLEPEQVERSARSKPGSKRRPNMTLEQLQDIADGKGVGELFKQLVEGLSVLFDTKSRTLSSVAFIGNMDGGRRTIFSLVPGESDAEQGLSFTVRLGRLAEYLGVDRERLMAALPPSAKETEDPSRVIGFFQSAEEVEHLLAKLSEFKSKSRN
jgi:hypothetical protein